MAKIKSNKTGRFIKQPLEQRFWQKVNKKEDDQCWEWLGFKIKSGYGRLRDENKQTKQATHISWFIEYGDYPKEYMCHTCDNPSCVNPKHLFEGDAKANVEDMVKKKRNVKGSKSYKAILTEDIVSQIKKEYTGAYGDCTRLAKKYGTTYSTISKIMRNLQWTHVV